MHGSPPSRWQTGIGIARLMRLSNSIPAALLVVLGAHLAGASLREVAIWQAALGMWAITAFGYISNDLFDLVEDRINKPDRPLASGVVTIGQALWVAVMLVGFTALFVFPLGWIALGVAVIVLILLLSYNAWLKATPGWGNILIALLAGAALLPGAVVAWGWSAHELQRLLLPTLMLSSFIATREVLKTLEDRTGDLLAGKRTISIVIGPQRTLYFITLLAAVTLILTFLPLEVLHYSWAFMGCMLLGVDLPLIVAVSYCYRNLPAISQDGRRVRPILALLKCSYFAGLLALLLA